jgi:hypothetical protein
VDGAFDPKASVSNVRFSAATKQWLKPISDAERFEADVARD